MDWLKRHKGRLVFLAVLAVFSYFNSLNNEFVSDDVFGIVNNDSLGDFSQVLGRPFYFLRPFLYWLVFSLFGKQAIFFRLVNLFFHVLTVWGVYALVGLVGNQVTNHLSLRCRPPKVRNPFRLSLIAAMLLAVHPLGVESVAWISGGSYVQMAAFSIWSLVFYVKAMQGETLKRGRTLHYWGSVLLLVLALVTMERAVIVVGLMFLISLLFGDLKRDWKYMILPAALGLLWVWVSLRGVGTRQESLQTGFYNEPAEVNFWLQTPVAIAEYLKLFVWPVGLTLYHSDLVFAGWQMAGRIVATLGFLAGVIWTFFKNKRVFFWLAWFLICLSPTLLPLGISWVVAERYVYMAMIGLVVVVAMGFEWILGRVGKDGKDGVNFGLMLLVGVLMFRTILRNNDWQTADSLWFSAERYSTLSPQNHNNLGDAYGKRGMLELSRDHFLRAIELNPRYADAMHNLGNTYLQMGEIEKARESFKRALEVNPNLWQSERALKAIEEWEGGR